MVRNIVKVYHQSTPDERRDGAAWYPIAQRACAIWSEKYGVPTATVASVIAALSPQCEWQQNLRAALAIVSGEPVAMVGGSRPLQANVVKALRIFADRATLPDDYFKAGWKVRSFARNLQGCPHAVTVDTHAGQIALNDVTETPRVDRAPAYEAIASAYVQAAAQLNKRSCDVQATTWLAWKRIYSPSTKRSIIKRVGYTGGKR